MINLLIIIPIIFVVSCQTTPIKQKTLSREERNEKTRKSEGVRLGVSNREDIIIHLKKPDWVLKHPVDDNYYIGIGQSSDTGNPDEDRERARLSALNELAQGISVTIMSEMKDERKEILGEYYENVRISISTSVDINIQEADLIDTYHSKEDGYWFYYRLSKKKWEEIKQKKIQLLKDRIEDLVEPVNGDLGINVSDKISILSKCIALVLQSGFAGTVKSELFGEEGYTLDLLTAKRQNLLSSFSVKPVTEKLEINPGDVPIVKINISSDTGEKTGILPLILKHGDRIIDKVITTNEGVYEGNINIAALPFGESNVSVMINLFDLGFQGSEAIFKKSPKAKFSVKRRAITALLTVIEKDDTKIGSIYDSVKSLFAFLESSEEIVLQFVDDRADSDLKINFSLYFRDSPKKVRNILFTYAQASISLEKNGQTIMNYETPEYKDMGLDNLQARERATNKLIENLKKDESLKEKFITVLKDYLYKD